MKGFSLVDSSKQSEIRSIGLVFQLKYCQILAFADGSGDQFIAHSKLPYKSIRGFQWPKADLLFAFTFRKPWTIVPVSTFDEQNAEQYLQFNTRAKRNSVKSQHILGLEAMLISEEDNEAQTYLYKIFKGHEVAHGMGPFLECSRKQAHALPKCVFILQYDDIYSIAVYQSGQLLFANSISAVHLDDFLYFIFYIFKQLNITDAIQTFLLGDAIFNKALKDQLHPYVSEFSTLNLDKSAHPLRNFSADERNALWIGIYTPQCAL